MSSVTLFIDTNAFIQLRDLKDLPWAKLFKGVKHVRIMVARVVIEELDKHKVSTRQRQRDRARAALKLVQAASKESDRTLVLRTAGPKVTLEVPPRLKVDWEYLSILDASQNDDRLVAEAVTFGQDAALLSHDSGPLITARDVGLKGIEPPEDWHLPSEQSDADKKVALLERQLTAARSTKPKLELEIDGKNAAGEITVYRPVLPALESDQIDRLTKRYLLEYPRAAPVASGDIYSIAIRSGISRHRVSEYHADYDAFEDQVREFFQRLHEFLYYLVIPSVTVTVRNVGSVSAVNFHVGLQTSGGIGLLKNAKTIRKMCPFPEAPDEPQDDSFMRLSDQLWRGGMPKAPHPTEIVWIDEPSRAGAYGRYGCADFQPERVHPKNVALWPLEDLPATGVLTVKAGANDIPNIKASANITIEKREDTWSSPQVLDAMPAFMRTELKTLKWSDATHKKMEAIARSTKLSLSSDKTKKGQDE